MPYIVDNHAIINTCGDRFLAVVKKQNIPEVWYQAINAPAHEVKWDMQYLSLRGFHIEMTFQRAIGDRMSGLELELIWIEAGITTRGIANKVMNGKDYKTGMRLHKLTWQAGLMIIIHQFF